MSTQQTFLMCCPCHFGLERTLRFELTKLGATDLNVQDGRIIFRGDYTVLAKANLCLSVAERVLVQLAEFPAYSFEDLFQGVKKIPLEDWIGRDDAFPVKGHALDSKLHSVPDCQSIVKKAAVERLKQHYHTTWFAETGAVHQIQFSIRKNIATIYLDTSGIGLHKRGYRRNSNTAPIKETLAAGIIDLARVRTDTTFVDPFCGSGTFLIEATFKAMHIAPGLNRHFAAEKWGCIPEQIWRDVRAEAISRVQRDADFEAFGYDIDPEAVRLTQENAKKAGLRSRIHVEQRDISDFTPIPNSITVCNPPYGERMLDIHAAESLYKIMGEVFPADADHPCYVISPDNEFETFFGKPAAKRRKLYNGMIACQLYMYY